MHRAHIGKKLRSFYLKKLSCLDHRLSRGTGRRGSRQRTFVSGGGDSYGEGVCAM
jgi:hypothetical protein